MASACDPSPNRHSPELPSDGGGRGVASPRLRRGGNLSSPWAQVVRGDQESISAVHQSLPSSSSSLSSLAPTVSEQIPISDCSPPKAAPAPAPSSPPPAMENSSAAESSSGNDNGIAAKSKKPAWNTLSNGVVESGSVMGAASWPALSESTRASPKPSADSSSKPLTEGSNYTSQGPVKTHSSKRQVNATPNPNSNQNHPRQRPIKRGGGGGGAGAGGGPAHSNLAHPLPQTPTPPQGPAFPLYQMPSNAYGSLIPAIADPSPRDPPFRRPVLGSGYMPQPHHRVNDPRNSSRRGNFIHHPQGDGPYHGGRRDQGHGNFPRDAHMQPQRGPPPPPPLRGYMSPLPPPNAAAYVPPLHPRPYTNPMDVVYFQPFDPIRGGSYIAHPSFPPTTGPRAEAPLPTSIVSQIDYYFSDANLVKDEFLRSNMDDQGWVPISLIASFPRVKKLTTSIQLILSSLRDSSVVEVQDDKVRRRNYWMKWASTSGRFSGSRSRANSSQNLLAASVQKIALEEVAPSQNSISGKAADLNPEDGPEQHLTESTAQSLLVNGEVTTQNTH